MKKICLVLFILLSIYFPTHANQCIELFGRSADDVFIEHMHALTKDYDFKVTNSDGHLKPSSTIELRATGDHFYMSIETTRINSAYAPILLTVLVREIDDHHQNTMYIEGSEFRFVQSGLISSRQLLYSNEITMKNVPDSKNLFMTIVAVRNFLSGSRLKETFYVLFTPKK